MRLLVLGGTVFLSEAVAAEAVRRGHEVTCACRGTSGPVPEGARLVRWDRGAGDPPPTELVETAPDAVVDVARHPSWVRAAVAALPTAHWVLVSTVNVYADTSTPGGTPTTLPLVDPVDTDEDPTSGSDVYGAMKLACERLVQGGASSSTVVRPGLIVGPGDPSGRFTYWPERLAEARPGEQVLAGGRPTDVVQVIDVRDLAAWLVTLAEQQTAGVFDGVGPAMPVGELLAQTAAGVGSEAVLTWVADETLVEQGVTPWSGEQALPLWLPRPEYDGMLSHDVTPSVGAGLVLRPTADTARDTLAWSRRAPDVVRTGLSRERETEVLSGAG